ncbi:MAG: DUF294 nucleotidyltransferase-like domain-containing protein [Calditerrivibrio sp.]|nr:DUF294 nucleotidyltransferase-like domain-containing protein [Calditerrivibrio sp.]
MFVFSFGIETDRLNDILIRYEPFSVLSPLEIEELTAKIVLKKYKKGEMLVTQGQPVEKCIRFVLDGSAKVFVISDTGDEVVVDYRCQGDIIGLLSIATEGGSLVNVVVVDDLTCYELSKDDLYELFSKNYRFLDSFLNIYVKKYLRKVSAEFKENALYYGSIDRLFFTSLISYLVVSDYPSVSKDTSILEAARMMMEKNYSAAIVLENGTALGIITDKDLRKKVVAKGLDYNTPVSSVMSSPVFTVESDITCFEAIVKMVSLGVHHLVVTDNSKILGVVDSESLMNLQSSSPLSFAREIELQESVDRLSELSDKIINVSATMYRNGFRAENITKIVSELNDRVLRRIIEIGIKIIGEPPVRFCWLAMGSEGRKEQTFRTDQDNGIIFEDVDDTRKKEVVAYFKSLAEFVNDALIKCGFPPCPGNYMARNPEWCQPISTWKRYFEKFFAMPTTDAVLKGQIIFDFRGVYGDKNLSLELRNFINNLKNRSLFINFMAKGLVNYGSPLTFFGSFVTEKDDNGDETFDIKKKVLAPLVGIIRLFAIEEGLMSLSTLERINDLVRIRHKVIIEYYREIEQSFNFLLDIRMRNQIYQYISGLEVTNNIKVQSLSSIESRNLKLACQLLDKLHDVLKRRYGL